MKTAGAIIVALGIVCAAVGFIAVPWFLAFGCGMNTTGCNYQGSFLVKAAFSSDITWVFWVSILIGGALIFYGVNLFRSPQKPVDHQR